MKPHPIRRHLPGLLLLLGGLLLPTGAAAQTALLDVPGTGGTKLFQLNNDAGLLVKGTFGTGVIPATGTGMRLMWYPRRAAFRAGFVLITNWDDANIGNYSVAMGFNPVASGTWSTALGNGALASGEGSTALGYSALATGIASTAVGFSTDASGDYATAMGDDTEASGDNATAMGEDTIASGNQSTAMGNATMAIGIASTALGNGTEASGSVSTAMGDGTEASGLWSTAMGLNTTASGTAATAMGQSTDASGDYATAMGQGSKASGDYSTAMGQNTTASGESSTAMGLWTTASGHSSTAMGGFTIARGLSSTAMGSQAKARGQVSTAMGKSTTTSGDYATAMGYNTTAQAHSSLVLGQWNFIAGDSTTWLFFDPALVVGNGSSTASRSNALTLLKNGDLIIAGMLSQSSDRRLKRDIHPLTDALDGLARLQPVRYRFREGTNRPEGMHIGLIAQEVQAVFPELVQQGADGYLSVSYANLSAVLVQALHEQQTEIDKQEAKNDAQQARNDAQQAAIEALCEKNAAMRDRLTRLEAALLRSGAGPASATPARR